MDWKNANIKDLNNCLRMFHINKPERIRNFIAQCTHESLFGKFTQENCDLKYCSRYEGRKDLKNIQKGDGFKFKGAGYIQLTGKNNYQKFADFIKDKKVIEQGFSYVSANYPWTSAGFWWSQNGMNKLCDKGLPVKAITKRVNGGYNGFIQREKYYRRASEIF